MRRFKSPGLAQRFLVCHALLNHHFPDFNGIYIELVLNALTLRTADK
jgi:hypothetical protein